MGAGVSVSPVSSKRTAGNFPDELHLIDAKERIRGGLRAAQVVFIMQRWDGRRRKIALLVEMRWCSVVGCNTYGSFFPWRRRETPGTRDKWRYVAAATECMLWESNWPDRLKRGNWAKEWQQAKHW
jgi:hypothetical protein